MPDSEHRSPLTLEDLLQLKRAERPAPEFWTRFESELRQKQLAALIDRRPWWQMLPQLLVQRRAIIPIGATALVAFALVSVNLRDHGRIEQSTSSSLEPLSAPVQSASILAENSNLSHNQAVVSASSPDLSRLPANPVVVAEVPLSTYLPEHTTELTPWSAPSPVRYPTTKLYVSNVEQPVHLQSRLVKTLTSNSVLPVASRVQRSDGAIAELASVSALSSKRSRLLAQFGDREFTPEPQAPALVRERLTRRLADASFSEHFTRVGLKGDQVSLRF